MPPATKKPAEPESDKWEGTRALSGDRVHLAIKVTDKWGDVFVSTDVGYETSPLPGESAEACYTRCKNTVNTMYGQRHAEVRRALDK